MSENNINNLTNKSIINESSALKRMSDEESKTNKIAKAGWLLKWTNYLKGISSAITSYFNNNVFNVILFSIKGYQRRWFVLADGILSYYR